MKINKNVKKGIMPYILQQFCVIYINLLDFVGKRKCSIYDEFEGQLIMK